MKTHILENWNDGTAKVRGDRSMSKEELYQSLWGPETGTPAPESKLEVAASWWMARLINWLSKLLLDKVPVGYEDEAGFHYGTRPAQDKEAAGKTVAFHE